MLWLDRLRLLGTFTVVWLHTSAHVVIYGSDEHWWIGNIADTFSNWAVPAFVMITGALFLGKPLRDAPQVFYQRRLGRILIPLIAWSVFYIVWGAYRQQHFDLMETIRLTLSGSPYYHMWYIFMLVGLYLVAPYFNYFVWNVPRTWIRPAIIVFFAISMVTQYATLFGVQSGNLFLGQYTSFVGYFLAGHYFATAPRPLFNRRTSLIAFTMCGFAVALISGVLQAITEFYVLSYTYTSLNPLIMLMTFSMFSLFQSTQNDDISGVMWLKRLSPLSLGIYMIHPFWLEVILQFYPQHILQFPIIGIPAYAVLAFVLSVITCHLLASVRVLKRVFL